MFLKVQQQFYYLAYISIKNKQIQETIWTDLTFFFFFINKKQENTGAVRPPHAHNKAPAFSLIHSVDSQQSLIISC